jgi:hypothetical protein
LIFIVRYLLSGWLDMGNKAKRPSIFARFCTVRRHGFPAKVAGNT